MNAYGHKCFSRLQNNFPEVELLRNEILGRQEQMSTTLEESELNFFLCVWVSGKIAKNHFQKIPLQQNSGMQCIKKQKSLISLIFGSLTFSITILL